MTDLWIKLKPRNPINKSECRNPRSKSKPRNRSNPTNNFTNLQNKIKENEEEEVEEEALRDL